MVSRAGAASLSLSLTSLTQLKVRHSERVNDGLLAAFADEHALTPRLQFAKRSPKTTRMTTEVKATLFAAVHVSDMLLTTDKR